MSQPTESAYATELHNMADSPQRKGNCCARHPMACGGALLVVMVVSAAAVVALGAAYHPVQNFLADAIHEQVALKEGGPAVKNFADSAAPTFDYFYFFHLTNPTDVQKSAAKPVLREIGPIVYKKSRTKTNLTWSNDNEILSYTLTEHYTLDADLSVGDPKNISVTTVNFPLIGILLTLMRLDESISNDIIKDVLKKILETIDDIKADFSWEGLFVTHTIEELLWGYEDPLLKELKRLPFIKSMVPSPFFSLYNRTVVETPNEVYTGTNNLSLVGQYREWNGRFQISQWNSPTARMINGTGGYLFHPGMTREEDVVIFVSELFRSGYFRYTKDVSIHGIQLYQYELPSSELFSKNQDPGFFPSPWNGLMNLTAVYPANVPVFVSKPHFLDADPALLNNVTGLHPNASIHDSYIGIEPITGAALSAAKRLQVNMQLQKSYLKELEGLPDNLMLPLLYVSEQGVISPALAAQFKKTIYGIQYGVPDALLGVAGIAGLTFLACSLCFFALLLQQWRKRRGRHGMVVNRPEHEPLLDSGDSSDGY